jgi:hypothetical protein
MRREGRLLSECGLEGLVEHKRRLVGGKVVFCLRGVALAGGCYNNSVE